MTKLEAACEGVIEQIQACAMVADDVPEFLQLCRERFERFAASQQGQSAAAPGPDLAQDVCSKCEQPLMLHEGWNAPCPEKPRVTDDPPVGPVHGEEG